jgi:hypothetical protein
VSEQEFYLILLAIWVVISVIVFSILLYFHHKDWVKSFNKDKKELYSYLDNSNIKNKHSYCVRKLNEKGYSGRWDCSDIIEACKRYEE